MVESNNQDIVLTVPEAARLLKVSENTLYSLVSQNLIPNVRFGKLIRIPRWGLLQHIATSSGVPLPDDPGVAFPPAPSVDVPRPETEEG